MLALFQHGGHAAPLLVIAAEQEEHLRLEGVARPVAVKIAQEGIFLKDFQQQGSLEGRLQQAGKGGFPHPDDSFDRKIHGQAPEMWLG